MSKDREDSWKFWKQFGEKPICLAPMVEMNDLAFRILVRRHEVKVCWTGMINSKQWNMSKKYQQTTFQTNEIDKPLICQISGSLDSDLLSTARSLSSSCCALDINLGCCQKVAKRGNYGYFMVDTENKRQDVIKLVSDISNSITVPLCVKIRMIENDINLTVNFAKELEKAGAKILTIHARSAQQDKSGCINIECVKEIVKNLSIPVIANGGITSKQEAEQVLNETGAAGVMIGQALLKNPALLECDNNDPEEKKRKNLFDVAREYLSIVKSVGGCGLDIVTRHLFYIFDNIMGTNNELRQKLSTTGNMDEIEKFVDFLEKMQND